MNFSESDKLHFNPLKIHSKQKREIYSLPLLVGSPIKKVNIMYKWVQKYFYWRNIWSTFSVQLISFSLHFWNFVSILVSFTHLRLSSLVTGGEAPLFCLVSIVFHCSFFFSLTLLRTTQPNPTTPRIFSVHAITRFEKNQSAHCLCHLTKKNQLCSQIVHYLKYFQAGNVLKKLFNQVKKFSFDLFCLVNLFCSFNGDGVWGLLLRAVRFALPL